MTLADCTEVLGQLAVAMRVDMDTPTFKAYHRVLKDVPVALLGHALTDLAKGGLRFFPTAPEILTAVEKTRRVMLALNPYDGCADCEGHIGYRSVLIEGCQPTVERCPCKARHLERLATMGLREPVAALPGEVERESEQIYPTVDQLPATLRQQIAAAAGKKALR